MNRGRSVVLAVEHLPRLLRRTIAKAWHDRVLGLSAEAAFWQLVSMPSLFLALVATLGYFSRWLGPDTVDRTEKTLENGLAHAFSQQVVSDVVAPMLHEILHSGRADVISLGFVIALWAGSSAMATFVNTITIAYDMRDLRGAVHSRLLALGLFLGSVLIGVILLPLLVLGPDLLVRMFPDHWHRRVHELASYGYYPVIVILTVVGLTTLYHLAPPRRLPWRRGIPGAVLALLIFLGGSALLRMYINYVLDRNHTYGTLATPVAALLFFFILALGVLLGAEFNAAIEAMSPTPPRQPRVLNPKTWRRLDDEKQRAAKRHDVRAPGSTPDGPQSERLS